MALTFSSTLRFKVDKKFVTITAVTLDNSYPTGGEAITANQLGLGTVEAAAVMGTPSGFGFEFDVANMKLKAYYADYDAVADGALIQVPNGSAVLDTIVVPLIAWGT